MSNKKNVIVMFSALLVVILGAGYFFVVSPFLARGAEQRAEVESAQGQRDAANTNLITAQGYEMNYPSVLEINNELSAQFPSTADIESLNNSIIQAASRAGIPSENITSITTNAPSLVAGEEVVAPPTTEEEVEGALGENEEAAEEGEEAEPTETAPAEPAAPVAKMARMDVTIAAEGNLRALYDFVGYLQEMDRTILILSSSAQADSEGGTGTLSILAVSYIYVELDDPLTDTVDEGSDIESDTAEQDATATEGTEVEETDAGTEN